MALWTEAWNIGADIAPDDVRRFRHTDRRQIQQQCIANRQGIGCRRALMDMPCRVFQQVFGILFARLAAMLIIFVNRFRNDVEMQPLCPPGLCIHE